MYVYRLQQLLFIYCLYVCVVVYAAFQANKVVYIGLTYPRLNFVNNILQV